LDFLEKVSLSNAEGNGGKSSRANVLFFLYLIAYNRRRSRKSYDSAIDVMPELFGAKSSGEQFLQFLRTSYQLALPDAYD
jgi:hypothetical protein